MSEIMKQMEKPYLWKDVSLENFEPISNHIPPPNLTLVDPPYMIIMKK